MHITPKIVNALSGGRPVVALETTVLTHGFGAEMSLSVYSEMLEAVRSKGAVPAPIGMVRGELTVGLEEAELKALAEGRAEKAGIADLPALSARKADAGTTVAATLFAATRAGIRVFATGGIGGVHWGAETTFDISGDLHALARFGGSVVCSGAKAVCDLPKTVELLETLGVPVVGFGTRELPAFTCPSSGILLRHRVDTPADAAALLRARDALGLPQAVLFANPPPAESSLSADELEHAVKEALASARVKGIQGPALTPHLLAEMERVTGGDSVTANRALLASNAALAAQIAVELAK